MGAQTGGGGRRRRRPAAGPTASPAPAVPAPAVTRVRDTPGEAAAACAKA
jgi:hypothetical protein